jgi:hypothetical protein
MSQQQEDGVSESIATLYFILYQQAGRPHGDTKQGFLLWCQLRQADFERFSTKEAN